MLEKKLHFRNQIVKNEKKKQVIIKKNEENKSTFLKTK